MTDYIERGALERVLNIRLTRLRECNGNYGRDARINEGGHFAPGGYVFNNGGSFVERYHGMEDIPPEHRIFAYPKLNIREQMAAYQEVIDRSALNEEKLRLPTSREDR